MEEALKTGVAKFSLQQRTEERPVQLFKSKSCATLLLVPAVLIRTQPTSVGEGTAATVHLNLSSQAILQGKIALPLFFLISWLVFVNRKNNGHSGSGFNYVCLPNVPDAGTSHNDNSQEGSLLYGITYTSYGYIGNLSSLSRYVTPCAMCEAERGDIMTLYGI